MRGDTVAIRAHFFGSILARGGSIGARRLKRYE